MAKMIKSRSDRVKYVIVHCSASPQGRGDDAKTIDRWHKDRGWSKIGYHFVILEDGTVQTGRSIYERGAHCKGYNDNIGVVLIGQGGDATTEQYHALYKLILEMLVIFPYIEPRGHSDFDKNKPYCPGFSVIDWWRIRKAQIRGDAEWILNKRD